jgi:hypothetical protein
MTLQQAKINIETESVEGSLTFKEISPLTDQMVEAVSIELVQ